MPKSHFVLSHQAYSEFIGVFSVDALGWNTFSIHWNTHICNQVTILVNESWQTEVCCMGWDGTLTAHAVLNGNIPHHKKEKSKVEFPEL